MKLISISFALLFLTLLAACGAATSDDSAPSENKNSASIRAAAATCSTGSPVAETATLNFEAAADLPECTARCGVERVQDPFYGRQFTRSALPSGSCTGAPTCRMSAVREVTCPSGEVSRCSLSSYVCRCGEDSSWQCYAESVGASACLCR